MLARCFCFGERTGHMFSPPLLQLNWFFICVWCLCSKRHTAQQRRATIGWFYAHGKGAATAAASAGGKSRKSRCCCVPKKAQNASRSKNAKCDVISLLTNEAKPILSFTFLSSHDLAVSKVWEILRKSSPFSWLFRMFNTTGIFHAYSSFFPMVLAQHRELRHKSKTKDLAQSPRLSRDTSNHIKRLVNWGRLLGTQRSRSHHFVRRLSIIIFVLPRIVLCPPLPLILKWNASSDLYGTSEKLFFTLLAFEFDKTRYLKMSFKSLIFSKLNKICHVVQICGLFWVHVIFTNIVTWLSDRRQAMLFVVRLSHFSRDKATLSMAWATLSSTEERSGGNKNGQETPCRIMIHAFFLLPYSIQYSFIWTQGILGLENSI